MNDLYLNFSSISIYSIVIYLCIFFFMLILVKKTKKKIFNLNSNFLKQIFFKMKALALLLLVAAIYSANSTYYARSVWD